MANSFYHALIRTHHITSRKKIAILKAATKKLECYALLRTGGVPGVMYVEGQGQANVQAWVEIVHGLRYKDYKLIACVTSASSNAIAAVNKIGTLEEVSALKEMSAMIERRGLLSWWKVGMGFTRD